MVRWLSRIWVQQQWQKGKGGFSLRWGHSALLEELERFFLCLRKIKSCTNHQQLLPETPAWIQRAPQERGTGRAGAGLGQAGIVAAQTDLQHGVEALLVQVAHDVGTDVVHGRSQGLTFGMKHWCHSNSTTAPLWVPHMKVCHCPSPPSTKSLSFYTYPSLWQHFTLYCLGCKNLISSHYLSAFSTPISYKIPEIRAHSLILWTFLVWGFLEYYKNAVMTIGVLRKTA